MAAASLPSFDAGLMLLFPALATYLHGEDPRQHIYEPNVLPNLRTGGVTIDVRCFIVQFTEERVHLLNYGTGSEDSRRIDWIHIPKEITGIYHMDNGDLVFTNKHHEVVTTYLICGGKFQETIKWFTHAYAIHKLPCGIFLAVDSAETVALLHCRYGRVRNMKLRVPSGAKMIDDFGFIDGVATNAELLAKELIEILARGAIPRRVSDLAQWQTMDSDYLLIRLVDPRDDHFSHGPEVDLTNAYYAQIGTGHYNIRFMSRENERWRPPGYKKSKDAGMIYLMNHAEREIDRSHANGHLYCDKIYGFGDHFIIVDKLGMVRHAEEIYGNRFAEFTPKFDYITAAYKLPCGIYVICTRNETYLYDGPSKQAVQIDYTVQSPKLLSNETDSFKRVRGINDFGKTYVN